MVNPQCIPFELAKKKVLDPFHILHELSQTLDE
jgi:hypothetical protein